MKNKLLRTTRRYQILSKSFSYRWRKQQFMYLERKQKHKDLIYDGTRTRTLRMWSTTVQLSWVSITQKWTLRVFFIIIRHVPNSLTCLCKTPPSIYILQCTCSNKNNIQKSTQANLSPNYKKKINTPKPFKIYILYIDHRE